MSDAIIFQFQDYKSADLALETLKELGYNAHWADRGEKPELHVHLEGNDITSALEIMQSFGGTLLEKAMADNEYGLMNRGYHLDTIPIPAHTVNEDWPDHYYRQAGRTEEEAGLAEAESATETEMEEKDEYFDPSGETYDHFSAGIRL